MLENLSAVPWGKLRDAYGSASEIPLFLEQLMSADSGKRRVALDELWSRLCHQSTLASASPAAVPFLMEVAEKGPPAVASEALLLVGVMACAKLQFSEQGDSYAPLSASHNPVRKAVAESLEQLLKLLVHPESEVRLAALAPVARAEPSHEAAALVGRILQIEEDPRSKAAAALAMLLLGERSRHLVTLVREVASDVDSPVEQSEFLDDLAAGELPEERVNDAVYYLIDILAPVVLRS